MSQLSSDSRANVRRKHSSVWRAAIVVLPLCIASGVSAQTPMDTIWVCATYDVQSSSTTIKKYVLRDKELYDLSIAEFCYGLGQPSQTKAARIFRKSPSTK